jgi:hypothetical protein
MRPAAATRRSGILEPVKEGTTRPNEVPAAQFADGVLMTDLTGHLTHEKNGDPMFVFNMGGKVIRIQVLPNSFLARMEAATQQKPSTVFRLTGRTTQYRGKNFIRVEDAVIATDQGR